jgi:hypothetical protein
MGPAGVQHAAQCAQNMELAIEKGTGLAAEKGTGQ